MATKAINTKSKKLEARVPHNIADAVEKLKDADESTGQFIVAALEGEIKKRQRKKAKKEPKD